MSITFRDESGETRLRGDLLATGGATGDVLTRQADGTYAPAAGGAAPHTQEVFNAPNTTVANNAQVTLEWGTGSGDSLLNVTAPTLPTIITTGIYAFSLTINSGDFTTGGYFVGTLEVDPDGTDVYMRGVSNKSTADAGPSVPLTVIWYATAGMQVKVQVLNVDGVASRDFNFACYVQRVG